MIVRARAPLRVSFGGGGTDVPPYCDERGGAVLSATINRYAYATLVPGGGRLEVRSLDYDASISYNLDDPFLYDGQLDLVKAVLDHFRKHKRFTQGLEIALHNDAPPGSGLGSSSAITVALVRALAEYLHTPLDPYQLAELAYKIERVDVGIKGGKQDQYAAAFGGFNFIEFKEGVSIVNPLRLNQETLYELEYSLVFAYVGGQHFSGKIIEKQVTNYQKRKTDAVASMDRLRELAYEMKRALLLGRLGEFGELLDAAWESKKKMAEGISTPHIDELYHEARQAGALGGKISGAGGGGFMFFLCAPRRAYAVQETLRRMGAQPVHFSFVDEGVRAWRLG
ncbi:GHMP kinase [Marinithermus hydrothermalis]|uniref:GHMP kinase n=1 Tax=Marinithermus hydrothermalis (strain DSM 14884 / JCM 11576 / T1) TaxID=869210 RepID=F2NKD9_MARHT|nr:GHMP kinase [Marinithermus hydrothermalis]AEB12388.1 GHMP kinase [Marinithermus hydrothermalis DSM 14884]